MCAVFGIILIMRKKQTNKNIHQKQRKNDYILMVAAIGLLVLSALWICFSNENKKPEIIGIASLTIDFGNEKRAFEGDIIERETPMDALVQASRAGNFSYKLDGKSDLAAIDNFSISKNKSWHWYLNDKKINKPVDEISLKSGDKILIKYE